MILVQVNGGLITCFPDSLHVKAQDQVRFHCEEHDHRVDFNKGDNSPFDVSTLTGQAGVLQTPSNVTKAPGNYRYSVTLDIGSIDPEVVIDPS